MKNISVLIILFVFVMTSCRTSKPVAENKDDFIPPPAVKHEDNDHVTNFSDQTTWILGYFNVQKLYQEPYSSWFVKGFDEYIVNQEAVKRLKEVNTPEISIKIVMGTWCPDSRREVPRFMRVMEEIIFQADKIQFIGVDNAKISPIENYEALNIQRVPTFIIYRNNVEVGRIIENPSTSLEQDMVNILTRNE